MRLFTYLLVLLLPALAGCTRLVGTSRSELREGPYRTASFSGQPKDRVYIQVVDDTLLVARRVQEAGVERLGPPYWAYPLQMPSAPAVHAIHYYQPSFDVDVLTIPFKYRPAVADFPAQLNSSFNAALYVGYRTDIYRVAYRRAPTEQYRRHITHLGISVGGFAGIGSTPVNPWVTQPAINSEYDGFIIPFGIATILGVNDLSFGIMLGMDHLRDDDRSVWIYREKPWVGASFGINLN